MSTRRLLVVHQSAELYGSDRSLLELLCGIDRQQFECIVCVPEHGPLVTELALQGFEVHVLPLVKVSRSAFTVLGLLKLPGQLMASAHRLDQLLAGRTVDVVYTNTLAVFAGAWWALLRRRPHVWHIREIIRRPELAALGLRWLAQKLSVKLICNSHHTREWVDHGVPAARVKSVVVWNGVQSFSEIFPSPNRAAIRAELGLQPDLPLVLMVGRVNAWKGQDLLIDAVDRLQQQGISGFQLVLVGGPPPGQSNFMVDLQDRVARSLAHGRIQVLPFTPNVQRYYEAADVAVMPSREPEPFGRVAIEGMAHGVPIIAADHGGLCEVVCHGESGLLFKSNDAAALAGALAHLIQNDHLRQTMGHKARSRQTLKFSIEAYRRGVCTALRQAAVL